MRANSVVGGAGRVLGARVVRAVRVWGLGFRGLGLLGLWVLGLGVRGFRVHKGSRFAGFMGLTGFLGFAGLGFSIFFFGVQAPEARATQSNPPALPSPQRLPKTGVLLWTWVP